MSKFYPYDIVRRVLPSGIKIGSPMIIIDKTTTGYICKDASGIVNIYRAQALQKLSTKKVIVNEGDFNKLAAMHGIGVFLHKPTPKYRELVDDSPEYIVFISIKDPKKRLIYHLGCAARVLKTIGYEQTRFQRIRLVAPLIKLAFIGNIT